jgi:hypothetical protein
MSTISTKNRTNINFSDHKVITRNLLFFTLSAFLTGGYNELLKLIFYYLLGIFIDLKMVMVIEDWFRKSNENQVKFLVLKNRH